MPLVYHLPCAAPTTTAFRALAAAVCCALIAGCGGVAAPRLIATQHEPSAAASVPRRLPVALVLSGGGLRGFAHLGVLQALHAQGLKPDLIVGTSVGAIVGGIYASGTPLDQFSGAALPSSLDPWGSLLVTPASRSAQLEAFVATMLATPHIEDFVVPFVAVASARRSGCLVLFGRGDAARAITASSALPGALAPLRIAGVDFADGGLGAPLPVRAARSLGAQVVVAVDVSFHAEDVVPDGVLYGVFHAGMVMARHLAAADRAAADLVLDPVLPPVPEVTVANRARLVEAGARVVRNHLPQLRRLFAAAQHQPPAVAIPAGAKPLGAPGCDTAVGVISDRPGDGELPRGEVTRGPLEPSTGVTPLAARLP